MNNEQLKQIFEDNAETIVTESENIEAMTESKFIEVVSQLLPATNYAETMAVDDDEIKAMAEKESIISYPLYKEDSVGTVEHINEKRRLYATAYIKGAKDMIKIKGSPDGWIKINSEKDLPSEQCYCWLRIPNDMFVALYVPHKQCFVDNDGEYYDDVITHYKPITKPQPPKNK